MKASLTEALTRFPLPPTEKWPDGVWHSIVLQHGSMAVGVFAPKDRDFQDPHTQDEIYFVVGGSGELVMDGQRTACQVGDVLFVPANIGHYFENFSDDFVTWVVFWGSEGGEAAG